MLCPPLPTRPRVGALGQVAGTVVTVAAFYRGGYGGFAFAFGRSRRDGQLAFQTAEGVEGVAAGQPALGAAGFAVQPVAFDVGDGFAVKGDPVQVAAAVVEVLQAAAAGQFDRGTVAVAVVVVAHVAAEYVGHVGAVWDNTGAGKFGQAV